MARERLNAKGGVERFYFVSYVVSAEGTPQKIDNGVIGMMHAVESLSDIRAMERYIIDRSKALTQFGGQILGDAGIQVRIIDYKQIRKE